MMIIYALGLSILMFLQQKQFVRNLKNFNKEKNEILQLNDFKKIRLEYLNISVIVKNMT